MNAALNEDYFDYNETNHENIGAAIQVIKAHSYNDTKIIGQAISEGRTVFVNIKEMDAATLTRMMDYLTGYCDCCQGKISKMSEDLVMVSLYTVDLMGDIFSSFE